MLKGFFSREKIVLGILTLVLLGLISFIFFRFQLASSGLIDAKELYSGVQRSLNPSQVSITLDKNDLKVKLKIISADQLSFDVFLKGLGVDNPVDQEIDIKLGDQSAEFLDKLLRKNNLIDDNLKPISLNLRILSKEIDFDNKKVFGPFETSTENLLESPSDTGNIKTQALGESGYLVEIDNPGKVLSEGTLSGELKLSENLTDSGMWQILTKLAKINLKIEDGMLSGTVFLK